MLEQPQTLNFIRTLNQFADRIPHSPRLEREIALNHKMCESIQQVMNPQLTLAKRTEHWESALYSVTEKLLVRQHTYQNLRPAEYHQPLIENTPIVDGVVMESYCPELKHLVDTGQTHTHAAFALLEYFLRDKYHNVDHTQVTELAKLFRQQQQGEPFSQYKKSVEQQNQQSVVPGKSPEESWVMKREIMDMMEITDKIRVKYLQKYDGKKTIFITDLMRTSAEALRTVHLASTEAGLHIIEQRDQNLIKSTETPKFRRIFQETAQRMALRPDILLSAVLRTSQRDFPHDAENVLHLSKKIETLGLEHLPHTGPIIIAFSHMSQWKDKTVPPNWDMARLLQGILQKRQFDTTALVAYVNYFRETAPPVLHPVANQLVDGVIKRIRELYGIRIIDVAAHNDQKVQAFTQQSLAALGHGDAILISPEGVPAREVIRPKRGVGMLARLSEAPVVGAAFREEKLPDGSFRHALIITEPRHYTIHRIPGKSLKEKDQAFANRIMQDIAMQLPEDQRGIFR